VSFTEGLKTKTCCYLKTQATKSDQEGLAIQFQGSLKGLWLRKEEIFREKFLIKVEKI